MDTITIAKSFFSGLSDDFECKAPHKLFIFTATNHIHNNIILEFNVQFDIWVFY